MNGWKSIVGLIVTSVLTVSVWAQGNTCEEQLNAATAEFEAGRFYSIPMMLKSCIDKGFTREQRQRAYLLLTQAYLLLEDPIGADNSYLEVLRANPEFLADTARDQIDVVYLSKRFTADPIFSLYGRIGGNTSISRVIDQVYTYGPPNGKPKDDYTLRPGFQIGGGVDWHFFDRLSLGGEVNFASTSYRRERTEIFGKDILESTDQQFWVKAPIMVKFIDDYGKIRPYGYAGYSFNYLLSDRLKVKYQNQDENPEDASGGVSSEPYESPSRDFTSIRNRINHAVIFGGGARVKSGLNYWFVDVRYSFGLTNLIKEDAVFSNEEVYRSGHVDDFLRLDDLSVSFGYVYPLYKPRKVKNARTKSVLKRIKKASE